MGGCDRLAGPKTGPAITIDPDTTIGSLGDIFAVESVPVEGYGLVGGLEGTGSAECPPRLRAYLAQYILTQLPRGKVDVDELIRSRDTAVVQIRGTMPAAVTKNQPFDLKVQALPGTQTTSLENGWLYGAELKSEGGFDMDLRVLARAEGPVFINPIQPISQDKRVGYILAGGRVLHEYKMTLALRKPNYVIARRVSDRLEERFGYGTAKALGPDQIELRVPPEYSGQKQRFISIVKAMYIAETLESTKMKVEAFANELALSPDKDESEIALEAIGRASLDKTAELLTSPNEHVRLRAARCMLNLGGKRGSEVLREIAMDKSSAYRTEALRAITAAVSRDEAANVSRRLLGDEDFNVKLAAYEQLLKLDDVTIIRRLIAGNFYLDQAAQSTDKVVFVSRSGQPKIVLFGAPIYCRENIFVQSADGNVTINAPAGEKHVSVIRRVPKRPDAPPIQLKCSFELGDIIRTLCEAASVEAGSPLRPGLNVSYSNAIGLVKQMCDKGQVPAAFAAGPLPTID
jgi:hypothetical protein